MQRVFISFSHDSHEHCERVYGLADRLRGEGLTVVVDRDMLPGGPPMGWDRWSERQVVDADRVLIVCTETYARRYEAQESPGVGLGVVCEAGAIRQIIYKSGGYNERFRVVLFSPRDHQHVPLQLERYHRFDVSEPENYQQMLKWLRGAEAVLRPDPQVPSPVQWPSRAEYSWPLADRKTEFAHFQKILAGETRERILLVSGPSNTGKTTLLSELRAYAEHVGCRTVPLDLKGCPSLESLLDSLRLDLGPEILRETSRATGTERFYAMISDLQRLDRPLLIALDAYEQASDETHGWVESQLLLRLDRLPAVVVVIGGQMVPRHDRFAWRTLTLSYQLQPIRGAEDWLEYTRRTWQCPLISHSDIETLTLAADGDPGRVSGLLRTLVQKRQAKSGR